MDTKSEIEIKEEILEKSLEDVINNEPDSEWKEIQPKMLSPNIDMKEEIEIKDEEVNIMKEHPEDGDQIEQKFVLQESQTLISDVEEKESDVLEGKSFSSSKPQTLAKKNDKMIERMDLESHTVSEGKIESLQCNYELNRKSNVKKLDMTKPSNSKLFKCLQCNYNCNRKPNLKRHMLTHAKYKYKCSHCSYECNNKGNLKKHVLRHADFKLFKCSH
ncbi:Zinc finger protein ZFAT, partial [Armadillidium nasatum]